jgi:hypothetical protein
MKVAVRSCFYGFEAVDLSLCQDSNLAEKIPKDQRLDGQKDLQPKR